MFVGNFVKIAWEIVVNIEEDTKSLSIFCNNVTDSVEILGKDR